MFTCQWSAIVVRRFILHDSCDSTCKQNRIIKKCTSSCLWKVTRILKLQTLYQTLERTAGHSPETQGGWQQVCRKTLRLRMQHHATISWYLLSLEGEHFIKMMCQCTARQFQQTCCVNLLREKRWIWGVFLLQWVHLEQNMQFCLVPAQLEVSITFLLRVVFVIIWLLGKVISFGWSSLGTSLGAWNVSSYLLRPCLLSTHLKPPGSPTRQHMNFKKG